ncbi:PREDICTED: 60S ribosomal protein L10-like [Lipotes vexillifer]|uniref:60S ribosomal protein L10-like n=1 Tax=Lipotes vexillifer TaxID=118797 RepID=A0A340XIM9_LIPVE|nr:PREDICTED: 60S ribosomal protein L10-like [Lipotes vexillifer]
MKLRIFRTKEEADGFIKLPTQGFPAALPETSLIKCMMVSTIQYTPFTIKSQQVIQLVLNNRRQLTRSSLTLFKGKKNVSSPGTRRGLAKIRTVVRLQTGMRGAFGKPQGTVARVHVGQVIMSIRTKLQNKEHVIEALCRAKFKFPGRQKIHISKKWGFTKFNADEFENMVAEKRLIPDGCGVKYIPNRGPLDKWRALHS